MSGRRTELDFWSGKRVFLTGHTGFKGAWLSFWLVRLGANVTGYAQPPAPETPLWEQLNLANSMIHLVGDVRDRAALEDAVKASRPEIVLHLAAQPLVRLSYADPVDTWDTNVMGTVHLLEAVRSLEQCVSVVAVTTDKVYANREWPHAYREPDRLGGKDPYSASKAAAEIVAASYREALFPGTQIRLATARAGNVIGGGDWAADRILPDLIRSLYRRDRLIVRNPRAVRPWQHVLDPLEGYLRLAEYLHRGLLDTVEPTYNFGPGPSGHRSVSDLITEVHKHWPGDCEARSEDHAPAEAGLLKLSIEKAQTELHWSPSWDFQKAVQHSVEWYRAVHEGADPRIVTASQIDAFESEAAS